MNKNIAFNIFTMTGSIEAYLLYCELYEYENIEKTTKITRDEKKKCLLTLPVLSYAKPKSAITVNA